MSWSLARRGGLLMMSLSGALKPSAVAGGPSVTRFTQSSCVRAVVVVVSVCVFVCVCVCLKGEGG